MEIMNPLPRAMALPLIMGYRLAIWKITELEAEDLVARTVPGLGQDLVPATKDPVVMTPAMVIPLEVQTARVVPETVEVEATLVIPAAQADLIAVEEVIPVGREGLMATEEIVPVDREDQAVRVMVDIKQPV